jgi:hypothetical protein
MAKRQIAVDLATAEAYNLVKNSSGLWASRPAFTALQTADAGESIIYSCMVRSNSGIPYFYTFKRQSDQTINCELRSHEYLLVTEIALSIKQTNLAAPVTHAVTPYNQVVFNSPGWTAPLFAYIGSSPVIATAVASDNPDTPSLPLAPGLVCSFGDRTVWAFSNIAYMSAANTSPDPRRVTASNLVAVAGQITDMFPDPSGNLVIVSTAETKIVDQAGLTSAVFDGQVQKIQNYYSLGYNNAAATRQGSYGLGMSGLTDIITKQQIPLTRYKRTRKIADIVGAGTGIDYRRSGKLLGWSQGLAVSFGPNRPFAVINLDNSYTSWWDDNNITGELVSISELDDGVVMFTFTSGVYALYGNSPVCACSLALNLTMSGSESFRTREIIVTTLADGVQSVTSYIRKSEQSETPAIADGADIIGNVWDTAVLQSLEYQSVNILHDVRADAPYFEIQIGRDTEVLDIQVVLDGQGQTRHRQ